MFSYLRLSAPYQCYLRSTNMISNMLLLIWHIKMYISLNWLLSFTHKTFNLIIIWELNILTVTFIQIILYRFVGIAAVCRLEASFAFDCFFYVSKYIFNLLSVVLTSHTCSSFANALLHTRPVKHIQTLELTQCNHSEQQPNVKVATAAVSWSHQPVNQRMVCFWFWKILGHF